MDKDTELAEKYFNGDFAELPERSSPNAQTHIKRPAENSKINEKPLLTQTFLTMKNSCGIYFMK